MDSRKRAGEDFSLADFEGGTRVVIRADLLAMAPTESVKIIDPPNTRFCGTLQKAFFPRIVFHVVSPGMCWRRLFIDS
jgi:hypothetical protein